MLEIILPRWKGKVMKRKIIDYGKYCVSIEDNPQSKENFRTLRVGNSKRSSTITLNAMNARKLAYALMFEADKMVFEVATSALEIVRSQNL
jgi:hypothetical protein